MASGDFVTRKPGVRDFSARAGTSLPLSDFYVVNSASTVAQINAALGAGDDLLFTPGVYSYASTINVTNPDTKIIGLGFPTIVPPAGNTTMNVADVNGVNISGIIFDAGTDELAVAAQHRHPGLDRQPRQRPGHRRRRLLPDRWRHGGHGRDCLHRQQQQLDHR